MDTPRTPVQMFILFAGVLHLVLGVGGFIGPFVEGAGAGGEGELFGVLAVNGALNILNLAGGTVLVIAAMSIMGSIWASRAYAVLFAVLAVWGVMEIGLMGSDNTVLGNLFHVNVVNNWAYIALAALYAIFGLVPQMWRSDVTREGPTIGGQHAYR